MIGDAPSRPHSAAGGLARLLGSFDRDLFLREYLGEKVLHASGSPTRWSDLFSWQELNSLLNQGVVEHPQARLVSRGQNVEPSLFTTTVGARRHLDWWRMQKLMAQGATLVVTRIEYINERLTAFVESLACELGGSVHVDAVITCASVPGLNLHWDDGECFNVQIDGEKEWTVVAPPRPYPLTATRAFPERRDHEKASTPEGAEPTWKGIVKAGDLIYLPRGWWHSVAPHTQPSLHLSLSVDIPTLSDFVRWYAVETTRRPAARKLIPTWLAPDARGQQLESLLREVADGMPAALETYLDQIHALTPRSPAFELPAPARAGYPVLESTSVLTLRVRPPLHCSIEDGLMTWAVNGHTVRFDARMMPVLQRLETSRSITLQALKDDSNPILFHAFLLTLMAMDLVEISLPRASQTSTIHQSTFVGLNSSAHNG